MANSSINQNIPLMNKESNINENYSSSSKKNSLKSNQFKNLKNFFLLNLNFRLESGIFKKKSSEIKEIQNLKLR